MIKTPLKTFTDIISLFLGDNYPKVGKYDFSRGKLKNIKDIGDGELRI